MKETDNNVERIAALRSYGGLRGTAGRDTRVSLGLSDKHNGNPGPLKIELKEEH